MPRADTMIAILMLLRARGRMSARQLAEELEVSIRTVYRCMDALLASGVPIEAETGRDGGYAIPANVRLDPLFFDPDEQKALVHAARFARESGYPHTDALNRAIARIKRYNAEVQSVRLAMQERHYGLLERSPGEAVTSALRTLEQAADAKRTVDLIYRGRASGTMTKRPFDPYGLVLWRGYWYAVGYCRLRGELRSFRVDRIEAARATDGTFVRPADFSPEAALRGSLMPAGVEPDDSALAEVRIEGERGALDDLCGHWLFASSLVGRRGDEAIFRMDEASLHQYGVYRLLAYGGKLRAVAPPSLRAHLAEIAEQLLHEYGEPM